MLCYGVISVLSTFPVYVVSCSAFSLCLLSSIPAVFHVCFNSVLKLLKYVGIREEHSVFFRLFGMSVGMGMASV